MPLAFPGISLGGKYMQYCIRNPSLKKPEYVDAPDIEDINDNMDVLDGMLAKANNNASSDPSTGDDVGDGYSVLSWWMNLSGHKIFACESNATGTATWRQMWPPLASDISGTVADGSLAVSYIKADGNRGLSAAWDAGSWEIRAEKFQSDVATGTAPLIVASTTKVENLNADKLDDQEGSYYAKQSEFSSGWIAAPALTFASSATPSFTVTCSGDYSAIIMPGMRIKLTHSSAVKYFIVTKSTYSAPNTTLTLYGGTDYTLGATITLPYYSIEKAPSGFPLDPMKWRVVVTSSSASSQSTPTSGVWYNIGSVSMTVPIGVWNLKYKVQAQATRGSTGVIWINTSLSTSASSETNSYFTQIVYNISSTNFLGFVYMEERVVTTSATVYYLIAKDGNTGNELSAIYFNGSSGPATLLIAECAYL